MVSVKARNKRIAEEYRKNRSSVQIAGDLGIHSSTVRRILRKQGLFVRDQSEAARLSYAGKTDEEKRAYREKMREVNKQNWRKMSPEAAEARVKKLVEESKKQWEGLTPSQRKQKASALINATIEFWENASEQDRVRHGEKVSAGMRRAMQEMPLDEFLKLSKKKAAAGALNWANMPEGVREERRKKMSEIASQRWENPEFRAQRVRDIKMFWGTISPEQKEEWRKKMLQGQKYSQKLIKATGKEPPRFSKLMVNLVLDMSKRAPPNEIAGTFGGFELEAVRFIINNKKYYEELYSIGKKEKKIKIKEED